LQILCIKLAPSGASNTVADQDAEISRDILLHCLPTLTPDGRFLTEVADNPANLPPSSPREFANELSRAFERRLRGNRL
jgi:hypothetical protein